MNHNPPDDWNAYFIAPLLTGIGVGVIFGSLFAMNRPTYAALLIAGVGVAVMLAGLVIMRGLAKSDSDD